MTDIFISYSSKDKVVANTICAKLEQEQMKCWIAPRDISPGEEWASGIVKGIDNAKCIVVVFSQSANDSKHVLREIERAIDKNIIVIPFKIDEVMPSDSMEFFLKVAHWLDAHDDGLDNAIHKLKVTIAAILDKPLAPKSANHVSTKEVPSKKSTLTLVSTFVVLAAVGIMGWLQWAGSPADETEISKAKPDTLKVAPENVLTQYMQANAKRLDQQSLDNLKSANSISQNIPNQNIAIKSWVSPERELFFEGEKLTFKVSMDQSAYLLTYVHSVDGSSYLIYPNKYAEARLIDKDITFSLGQDGPFELVVQEPYGVDIVQFIATTDKKEFIALLDKHNEINGTKLSIINRGMLIKETSKIKSRGIKVEAIKVEPAQKSMLGQWGESFVFVNTKARK